VDGAATMDGDVSLEPKFLYCALEFGNI